MEQGLNVGIYCYLHFKLTGKFVMALVTTALARAGFYTACASEIGHDPARYSYVPLLHTLDCWKGPRKGFKSCQCSRDL